MNVQTPTVLTTSEIQPFLNLLGLSYFRQATVGQKKLIAIQSLLARQHYDHHASERLTLFAEGNPNAYVYEIIDDTENISVGATPRRENEKRILNTLLIGTAIYLTFNILKKS